jgi:hypothetical protein
MAEMEVRSVDGERDTEPDGAKFWEAAVRRDENKLI